MVLVGASANERLADVRSDVAVDGLDLTVAPGLVLGAELVHHGVVIHVVLQGDGVVDLFVVRVQD